MMIDIYFKKSQLLLKRFHLNKHKTFSYLLAQMILNLKLKSVLFIINLFDIECQVSMIMQSLMHVKNAYKFMEFLINMNFNPIYHKQTLNSIHFQ